MVAFHQSWWQGAIGQRDEIFHLWLGCGYTESWMQHPCFMAQCFDHGHKFPTSKCDSKGKSGKQGGKLLAISAATYQSKYCLSRGRGGLCSHLTSLSSDLSKLPGLLTPAVSLGATEGCCGSEMFFRSALTGTVLPVSAETIPRPGENHFILWFIYFYFCFITIY